MSCELLAQQRYMLLHLLEPNSNTPGRAKVFIGGSRHLSRLNKEIKHRLDSIIEKDLTVMVGDANGADKAVQTYLARKEYKHVVVFCMVDSCRNNVGSWRTEEISPASHRDRGAVFFSKKDRAMGAEADYGLMLWDGKSRGTLANIRDLVDRKKPVVVYLAPTRSFVTLRREGELTELLSSLEPGPQTVYADSSHSGTNRPRRLF
jgi:hypothetical protein